jgi:hypothetical protein
MKSDNFLNNDESADLEKLASMILNEANKDNGHSSLASIEKEHSELLRDLYSRQG